MEIPYFQILEFPYFQILEFPEYGITINRWLVLLDHYSVHSTTFCHPDKLLLELSEKEFNQRLTQAFEARLGQVEISEERQIFPLRQRHAVEYIQPGLALIGDAAHTIHPLAGQGVNLGFMDVAALTQVLQKYQQQRKMDNLAMMALMESFKRLFAVRQLPVLLLRNLGMKLVNSSSLIKRKMIARVLGLRSLA